MADLGAAGLEFDRGIRRMTASAHQPHYLPWLGYFDKIASADRFIVLDRVQFKKNDYQNRNRIKGPNGPLWLTVPVLTKGRNAQRLCDVEINSRQRWQRKHWRSLEISYGKAPYWEELAGGLRSFYEQEWTRLVDLNLALLRHLLQVLGIATPLLLESEMGSLGTSSQRLVHLCRQAGASCYLAGAGGRAYMDDGCFATAGLAVNYQQFQHPSHRQQYMKQGFVSNLCVLDLLFNEGPKSLALLRGIKEEICIVP